MRVLHLTVEFPPIIHGGLGTAVGGLVQASTRADLDVLVLLVNDGGGGYTGSPTDRSPTAAAVPGGGSLVVTSWAAAYDTALTLIRGWRPDVLHLHVFWLWPVVADLQRNTGIPVVYTVHSLDRAEYEVGHGPPECLTQWSVQAATIHGADRVIALTSSEQDLVAEYCPAATGKVRVVGNGIDTAAAAPASAHLDRDEGGPVVLFTGRFVDRKGVRELLAAIPAVLAGHPWARFVLAGGQRGATADQMDHWWRPEQLRGNDRVLFTGWLDAEQMTGWYRQADVLVVPSWYEPFGMVVLEGMLHGLAIAAADIGGPAEILTHRVTGLLFPPRNVPALTDALLQLTASAPLRRRLGRAAHREVQRTWAWPQVIGRMRRVYEELTPTPATLSANPSSALEAC